MRIALLGDVSMGFFAQDFQRAGHTVFVPPGFDTWRMEMLDAASAYHRFKADFTLVVDMAGFRGEKPPLPVGEARVCRVDLGLLARETPGFWDERLARVASFPFSLKGLKAIEAEFLWFCEARPAKVLALDADNTLWRGIAVEDGLMKIVPQADLQRGAAALRARGILLALLTKNDRALVRAVFARGEQVLGEGDFSFIGANWSPKAGNLLAAAHRLNLAPEAFVFLDDSAYERAEMKARLPAVAVPPFDPAEPAAVTLRRLETHFFPRGTPTSEDLRRAEMYRDEAARRRAQAACCDLKDYLRSLDLTAQFAPAADADVPRLAQMAGKTHQFNATARVCDAAAWRKILADPAQRVWTARARDRYGDMGLVAYAVYDCRSAHLTDFVMSCRAMGRSLEGFVLNHVRAALAREGRTLAAIDFTDTGKNGPFKTFLEGLDLSREQPTYFREEGVSA